MKIVRKPAVAGMFYPAGQIELQATLEQLFSETEKEAKQSVKMIVTPHAGYTYSGQTAAHSFAEIRDSDYSRVIILGPTHNYYFEGIAESDADFWETPLGNLKIASVNNSAIIKNSQYHDPEHCLEVQTPFLKYLLPDAEYIPLLVSGDKEESKKYAEIISKLDTDKTLWVISSDLTHFGSQFNYFPKKPNIKDGRQLDQMALELIQAHKIKEFREFLLKTRATICGAFPLLIAMHLINILGLPHFTLKDYSCSADITGDENSVGYGALYC